MPQIQKQQIGFGGQLVHRVVNVDSKGVFTAKLPDFCATVLDYDEVRGQSLIECIQGWNQASKEFVEMRTEVRKVICYSVKGKAYIFDKELNRVIINYDDISFCDGIAVAISASVYEERKLTKSDGKVQYKYTELQNSLPSSVTHAARFERHFLDKPIECLIEWTPEREAFFGMIGRGLEKVIQQLKQLSDPVAALQFADSGHLLSLTNTIT